jgi:hypothetical protein
MAQSGNARAFEMDDDSEVEGSEELESETGCPMCGSEETAFYSDRHGSYEFCKDCGWTDDDGAGEEEEEDERGSRPTGRPGNGRPARGRFED